MLTQFDHLIKNNNSPEVNLKNFFSWHEPTVALNYDDSISFTTIDHNLIQNLNFYSNFNKNSDLSLTSSSDKSLVSSLSIPSHTASPILNSSNLFSNLTSPFTSSDEYQIISEMNSLTNQTELNTTDESNVNTLYDVPLYLIVLMALAYGFLALTAVLGNSIVLWFVVRSRKLRTVTNIFIANLATADILIGALAIPFQFQVIF